jgi:hypothetical protein
MIQLLGNCLGQPGSTWNVGPPNDPTVAFGFEDRTNGDARNNVAEEINVATSSNVKTSSPRGRNNIRMNSS